jgi:hypothetical protein
LLFTKIIAKKSYFALHYKPILLIVMRRLIADVFKIAFKITNSKLISLAFALIYITCLNLLTIYGLGLLLTELLPYIGKLFILFSRPYIYLTILVTLLINFLIMLPLQKLSREQEKPSSLSSIIIYSVISLLLFLYSQYADTFL